LCAVGEVKLAENITDMIAHGGFADDEMGRHFVIAYRQSK
jgi:hypothetical protein